MTTSGGWEPGGVRGSQRGVTLHPFGRLPDETGHLRPPGETGNIHRLPDETGKTFKDRLPGETGNLPPPLAF